MNSLYSICHITRTYTILLLTLANLTFACTSDKKSMPETAMIEENFIIGNYVSKGYAKREEGYDWVSVAVSEAQNGQINISVRSRADKKKPTCTFDTRAQKVDESTYSTIIEGVTIFFKFDDDKMRIETENTNNDGIFSFYCSGGATVAGIYTKIDEALDDAQIDQTSFIRTLNLQGVGFNVSAIESGGINQLTVFTFGLPYEFNETFEIKDEVVLDAEVEDLNVDGSPELIVFTRNTINKKGIVHAFSVNNKKSMSIVYFPPIEENNEISNGYQYEDEFAIVETTLVHRFPIFDKGNKTGKMRQIQYELVEGEAGRRFSVKKHYKFRK